MTTIARFGQNGTNLFQTESKWQQKKHGTSYWCHKVFTAGAIRMNYSSMLKKKEKKAVTQNTVIFWRGWGGEGMQLKSAL